MSTLRPSPVILLSTLALFGSLVLGCGSDDAAAAPTEGAGGGAAGGGASSGGGGSGGGGGDPFPTCPADEWTVSVLPRTGRGGYGEAFISYDGKLIYEDELPTVVQGTEPRVVDLFLRSVEDPSDVEASAQIYGTVLSITGDVPYEDLRNIRIVSLATYHGKLLAGVMAEDSPDAPGGCNDTYRRRIYVTASVPSGHLISNPIHDEQADEETLTVSLQILRPRPPQLPGEPIQLESPTTVGLRIRSATSQAGLDGAPWLGPDGPDSSYQDGTTATVPTGHEWLQVRADLHSDDPRLTPVVDRMALLGDGGRTVFAQDDWQDPSSYAELSGIGPALSPGELVLSNLTEAAGGPAPQVVFVEHFQAPVQAEPPEWLYSGDLGDPSRNFGPAGWPYNAVISMAVFQDRLMINVGNRPGPVPAGATAGEFVSYDYASGLVRTESRQYSALERDWWQEGNGRLRVFGNLLINNGIDTKMRDLGDGQEVPPGSQMYYLFTGPDERIIGNTPADFGNHLWDIQVFAGRLLISRNGGTWFRDLPQGLPGHAQGDDSGLWSELDGAQRSSAAVASGTGHAAARFIPYGDKLIVYFHEAWVADQTSNRIRKILTYDQDINKICEIELEADPVDETGLTAHWLTHRGRLVLWNAGSEDGSRLYYTPSISR